MLNSQRQTSTPTSAISPATTAVATPPDHSWRASTLGRARARRIGRLVPGHMAVFPGYRATSVLSWFLRPSVRLAAPAAAFVLSSP